jgi:tetratricopeptide (TPR) repeat protein
MAKTVTRIIMKNIFLMIIMIILNTSLHAQNNQEIFLQANQAYQKNDIANATALYESITNKGVAVCLNLGNCYYHQERFVDALVCWRRAQQHYEFPIYQAAQQNIAKLLDIHNIKHKQTVFEKIKYLALYGSPLFWQLAFLFVWLLLFILVWFKWPRIFVIINSGLIMVLAILVMVKFNDLWHHYAVITDDAVVYIGPGSHFTVQSKIPKMHEVVIRNKVDSWYNIAHAEGTGWISADKVSLIN